MPAHNGHPNKNTRENTLSSSAPFLTPPACLPHCRSEARPPFPPDSSFFPIAPQKKTAAWRPFLTPRPRQQQPWKQFVRLSALRPHSCSCSFTHLSVHPLCPARYLSHANGECIHAPCAVSLPLLRAPPRWAPKKSNTLFTSTLPHTTPPFLRRNFLGTHFAQRPAPAPMHAHMFATPRVPSPTLLQINQTKKHPDHCLCPAHLLVIVVSCCSSSHPLCLTPC